MKRETAKLVCCLLSVLRATSTTLKRIYGKITLLCSFSNNISIVLLTLNTSVIEVLVESYHLFIVVRWAVIMVRAVRLDHPYYACRLSCMKYGAVHQLHNAFLGDF